MSLLRQRYRLPLLGPTASRSARTDSLPATKPFLPPASVPPSVLVPTHRPFVHSAAPQSRTRTHRPPASSSSASPPPRTTQPSLPSGSLPAPPPTLLIYNQGIPRAAFAGLLRTSCSVFVGWSVLSGCSSLLLSAPGLMSMPSLSLSALVQSGLPALGAAFYSAVLAPFVGTVHLQVPAEVRADSRQYAAFLAAVTGPRLPSSPDQSQPSSSRSSHPPPSFPQVPRPAHPSQSRLPAIRPLPPAAALEILSRSSVHIRTPRLLGYSRLSVVPVSRLRFRLHGDDARARKERITLSPRADTITATTETVTTATPPGPFTPPPRWWPRPWLALANLFVAPDPCPGLAGPSEKIQAPDRSPAAPFPTPPTPRSAISALITTARSEFFVAAESHQSVQKNSLAPGVWTALCHLIRRQTEAESINTKVPPTSPTTQTSATAPL